MYYSYLLLPHCSLNCVAVALSTLKWEIVELLCDVCWQRFYGKSLPFGNDSFKHPYVDLLSAEQALADYAVLVTALKTQLNASDSRVIAFGGRYVTFSYLLTCTYLLTYLRTSFRDVRCWVVWRQWCLQLGRVSDLLVTGTVVCELYFSRSRNFVLCVFTLRCCWIITWCRSLLIIVVGVVTQLRRNAECLHEVSLSQRRRRQHRGKRPNLSCCRRLFEGLVLPRCHCGLYMFAASPKVFWGIFI